jgi:hypothetical protein
MPRPNIISGYCTLMEREYPRILKRQLCCSGKPLTRGSPSQSKPEIMLFAFSVIINRLPSI